MEADDAIVGLVEAEVIKAGPDGIGKHELQSATALGTNDLREALDVLSSEDIGAKVGVHATGAYYHLQYAGEGDAPAAEDGEGALPVPSDATAPVREEPGADPGEPDPDRDAPADGLRGFRITWETTVEYRSADPRTAIEDGKTIVMDAQQGILDKSPRLGVQQQGLVVTEFAERRIWPT